MSLISAPVLDVWNYRGTTKDVEYVLRDDSGNMVGCVRYKGMNPAGGGLDQFLAELLHDPQTAKAVAHYVLAHPDELDALHQHITGGAESREKAWKSEQHPRDDHGRFVNLQAIHAAAHDPKAAAELKKKVTDPAERKKLDAAMDAARRKTPGSVPTNVRKGRGTVQQTAEQIHQTRQAAEEAGGVTRDHIHDLMHLIGGHTVAELRELKKHLGVTTTSGMDKQTAMYEIAQRALTWAKEKVQATKDRRAKGELTAKLKKEGFTGTDAHGRNWEGGQVVKGGRAAVPAAESSSESSNPPAVDNSAPAAAAQAKPQPVAPPAGVAPQTLAYYQKAVAKRDAGKLVDLLAPANKTIRQHFEQTTGVKLPAGKRDLKATLADWAAGGSGSPAPVQVKGGDKPAAESDDAAQTIDLKDPQAVKDAVHAAAATLPDAYGNKPEAVTDAWQNHKVLFADLYDHLKDRLPAGTTLDQFKAAVAGHRGALNIGRADLDIPADRQGVYARSQHRAINGEMNVVEVPGADVKRHRAGQSAPAGTTGQEPAPSAPAGQRAGEYGDDHPYQEPQGGRLFDDGGMEHEGPHHEAVNKVLENAGLRLEGSGVAPRRRLEDSLDELHGIDAHLKAAGHVDESDHEHGGPFADMAEGYRKALRGIEAGEYDSKDHDFDPPKEMAENAASQVSEGFSPDFGNQTADQRLASKYHTRIRQALEKDIHDRVMARHAEGGPADAHALAKREAGLTDEQWNKENPYDRHTSPDGINEFGSKAKAQKALRDHLDRNPDHEGYVVPNGGGRYAVMTRKQRGVGDGQPAAVEPSSTPAEQPASESAAPVQAEGGHDGIHTLTREQFFNDPSRVRQMAEQAGLKGEKFQDFAGKGKTLRVVDKNKPLNNQELFEYGKKAHREAVEAAVKAGKPVPDAVKADYPDLFKPSVTQSSEQPAAPAPVQADGPKAGTIGAEVGFQRTTPRPGTPDREKIDNEFSATYKRHDEIGDQIRAVDNQLNQTKYGTNARAKLERQRKELAEKRDQIGQQYETQRKIARKARLEDHAESDDHATALSGLMELNHPGLPKVGEDSGYNRLRRVVADEAKKQGVGDDIHDSVVTDAVGRLTGWDQGKPLTDVVGWAHKQGRTETDKRKAIEEMDGLNLTGHQKQLRNDLKYANSPEDVARIIEQARGHHAENEKAAAEAKTAEQKKRDEFAASPRGRAQAVIDSHTGWVKSDGTTADHYTPESLLRVSADRKIWPLAGLVNRGVLTDAKMATHLPDKLKEKLVNHPLVKDQATHEKLDQAHEVINDTITKAHKAASQSPASVVAEQPSSDGGHIYLLRDENGRQVRVDGNRHATMMKIHPGATPHLTDNRVVAYKKDGKPVGVLYGMGEHNGEFPEDVGSLPEKPGNLSDQFERAVPDDQVGFSKESTKGGLKEFDVGNNHEDREKNVFLTVKETPGDKGTYRIFHRNSKEPLATGLSKKKAKELATHIVAHAHGEDENGPVFVPKGGDTGSPVPAGGPSADDAGGGKKKRP